MAIVQQAVGGASGLASPVGANLIYLETRGTQVSQATARTERRVMNGAQALAGAGLVGSHLTGRPILGDYGLGLGAGLLVGGAAYVAAPSTIDQFFGGFIGSLNATFTFSPSLPQAGEQITFDASQSTGSISQYSWDFGDGTSGAGETTTHTYDAQGDYLVKLTITGQSGAQTSTTEEVLVSAPPGD